jgi:endo-1,4-beta-xylanase
LTITAVCSNNLVKMKASLLFLLAPFAAAAPTVEPRQAAQSIDALIKAKGKEYFGTCTDQRLLQTGRNAAIIEANFGSVTPENSMKWESLNPQRGVYTWGQADYLVNWATQRNKTIRGHTLVWHSQLAGWVRNINNRNELIGVIENHIKTVMDRYKGKIYHWVCPLPMTPPGPPGLSWSEELLTHLFQDVINEMFNEDGSLRPSVFSNVLRDEFVGIAFRAARAADPSAKLYINDYNLDQPGYAKVTRGMVDNVRRWLSQGIPIDGIGTQGHLQAGQGAGLAQTIRVLAGSGVKEVAVTELDIQQGTNTQDYANVVRGCLDEPKCVGITVWGVRDQVSDHQPGHGIVKSGNEAETDVQMQDSWRPQGNPLLFDSNYNPKANYNSIVQLLSR